MLSPQALIKGIIGRSLRNLVPAVDGTEEDTRLGKYGDLKVESAWPDMTLLCDEGAYMVASMAPAQTALQLGISASFAATAAAFVLQNTDAAGTLSKRVYPKFLRLAVSVVGTSGVDLRYAIVLDSKDRTPSTISNASGSDRGPGTPATATAYRSPVFCTNMDENPQIIGVPYFPLSTAAGAPPTVPSAGQSARTVVAQGFIKNSALVAKDQIQLVFGAVDIPGSFQGAAALCKLVEAVPAVALGPGNFLLIYLWSASNVTAGNAFDDAAMGWVEK